MSLEISGQIEWIGQTVQVSEKFKKRELVLAVFDTVNGKTYTNYAKMQVVQAKCDILDGFKQGEMVKVNFNVKGNKNEKEGKVSYITNLDVWRIERVQQTQQPTYGNAQPMYGPAPAPQQQQHYATAPQGPVYQAPSYGPAAGTGTVDDLPF